MNERKKSKTGHPSDAPSTLSPTAVPHISALNLHVDQEKSMTNLCEVSCVSSSSASTGLSLITTSPVSRPATNMPSPILSPRSSCPQSSNNSVDFITSAFAKLGSTGQSQLLLDLLSRSSKSTLQQVSLAIRPALRVDFLHTLPAELSFHVLKFLDLRSLGRCSQVSQGWRFVVQSDAIEYSIWKRRLQLEGWFDKQEYEDIVREEGVSPVMSNDSPDSKPEHSGIFKRIYKKHYRTRQNWMNGRHSNISFPAHEFNVVTCLQCDDQKIVSGSDIFDIENGDLLCRLEGHEGGVWALQYTGNTLVSGSTDRSIKIWDMETASCTHTFEGHTSTVRCLLILLPKLNPATNTYQPSVPLFCTGSRDATVRVWYLPDPKHPQHNIPTDTFLKHILTTHSGSVRAVAGEHHTLISGSYDMTVCIWDLDTGKLRFTLRGHREKVYSVGYCGAIKRCASGSMDATVKVWCTETGVQLLSLETHSSLVGLLDMSSEFLVSAAADGTLKIWDPMTGQCYSTQFGHSAPITCFHFSAAQNKFISGSDGGVKVWELSSFRSSPTPYREPNLTTIPHYGQSPSGITPIYGRMLLDLLPGIPGVWRVCLDERRIVTAVQKEGAKTWIEVYDFGCAEEAVGTRVVGEGDIYYREDMDEGEYHEDEEEFDEDLESEGTENHADDEIDRGDPPTAPLMRTLPLPPYGQQPIRMFPDLPQQLFREGMRMEREGEGEMVDAFDDLNDEMDL